MHRPVMLVLVAIVPLLAASGVAQTVNPLQIQWQLSYGGFGGEDGAVLIPVVGGDFIVIGSSASFLGGNKTSPNYGGFDYWTFRINSQGGIVWQRSDGGSSTEFAETYAAFPNGEIVIGGVSGSYHDGNKTNDNGGFTLDPWLVRLDVNGNKIWDREVGAGFSPVVAATSDGGVLFGAPVRPNSTRNLEYAIWRLAADGNTLWSRMYGGTGNDSLEAIQQTRDGGFLLGGASNSGINGDKTAPNLGSNDFWLVRLDANGAKLWDRTFGSTAHDSLKVVSETPGGEVILAGVSAGTGGNKTSPHYGSNDFWVVLVDANGNHVWDRTCGGSAEDNLLTIELLADGGFIAAGYSESGMDGNKTAPAFGAWDVWIVRFDRHGQKLWDQSLGGTGLDVTASVKPTADGGFMVGAATTSHPSGNKTTPFLGESDIWLLKLGTDSAHLRWERCCAPDFSQWSLRLRGWSNRVYRTDVSADLLNWTPFKTNQLEGNSAEIFRSPLNSPPRRYFRAGLLP